jgi:hypothetical protein
MARRMNRCAWAAGLLAPLLALAAAPETSPAPSDASRETSAPATEAPRLRFEPDGLGGFLFDTGIIRGRLHAGGASLGVTEAYHVPTGARLDQSKGLLSHYRVFANGRRFGNGAWDWPSTASLLPDGRVEVRWADTNDRPFTLRARYQLTRPGILTVETLVEARAELRGFEVFLASYFDPAFTNSFVLAKGRARDGYANATLDKGEWQMYPRDAAARALAEDGRWQLEPHPVNWTFPAELASGPTVRAFRRALGKGLLATFSADAADCFAVATPHQTEAHFSTYLSLFGRTLAAGETARARVALVITGPAAPASP